MSNKLMCIFSAPQVRNKNVFCVWKDCVSECMHVSVAGDDKDLKCTRECVCCW